MTPQREGFQDPWKSDAPNGSEILRRPPATAQHQLRKTFTLVALYERRGLVIEISLEMQRQPIDRENDARPRDCNDCGKCDSISLTRPKMKAAGKITLPASVSSFT